MNRLNSEMEEKATATAAADRRRDKEAAEAETVARQQRAREEDEERQRVDAEAAAAAAEAVERQQQRREAKRLRIEAKRQAAAAEAERLAVLQRQEDNSQSQQAALLMSQLKVMEEQLQTKLKDHQRRRSSEDLIRFVTDFPNDVPTNTQGDDMEGDDVDLDLDTTFGALGEGEMDEFAWLQDLRNVTDNDSLDGGMVLELEMNAADIDALLTGRDVDMEGGMDEDEGKLAAQRANARIQAAAKAADRSLPNSTKKGKKNKSSSDEPTFAPLTWTNVQKRGPVKEGLTTNWGVAYFNVGDNGLDHLPR